MNFFRYTDFRSNVVDNLDKPDFDKAICETMLNQKYFNGVGNYLRAEVLHRAGVPPFLKARDALQHLAAPAGTASKKAKKGKDEDLLQLCNIVMQEVLELSGNFVGGGGVRAQNSNLKIVASSFFKRNVLIFSVH